MKNLQERKIYIVCNFVERDRKGEQKGG